MSPGRFCELRVWCQSAVANADRGHLGRARVGAQVGCNERTLKNEQTDLAHDRKCPWTSGTILT